MNYTWKLESLRKTNTQSLNNVIVQTYWKKIGTDENGNEGSFAGATPFDISSVDQNNFISYEDLTEEIVLDWIKSVVVGDYESHVNEQIQRQINEKVNPVIEVTNSSDDGKEDFPWVNSN